ncbi:MAG TPA: hypothetical protein VM096_05160 [Vicinamibacterales bacterium]|nr:hypothetical protein [Vicinamibacterales bacterium]
MKAVVVLVILLAAGPVAAQTREPLPWFVVDVHAATVGLPQAEGWVPVVPAETVLPGRNWGLSTGATIYPFRLRLITFGLGASMIAGKGSSDVVHTGITSLVPQLSLNFGRKLGWSYLSAGLGRSKVSSRGDAVGTAPAMVVPEAWNSALNFGGGARWFMKPHLGAGFDVRFVKLASRSATDTLPAAKRTQVWNISVGISIQ